MRVIDAAAQAEREKRGGIGERKLLWIEARNRATGEIEAMGLWDGEDTEEITLRDLWTGATVTRVFHGAGALLSISGIRHQAGLMVRPAHIMLSAIDVAVTNAVRLYDPRGARVQVWRRALSAQTGLPVGDPEACFVGYCNKAPIPRPIPGGEAVLDLEAVSVSRLLTIPAERKKSDEAQRRRAPEDRFRRYKSVMGKADIPWGQHYTRGGGSQ